MIVPGVAHQSMAKVRGDTGELGLGPSDGDGGASSVMSTEMSCFPEEPIVD